MSAPVVVGELRSALLQLVGEKGVLVEPDDIAPYCEDWRQIFKGATPAVVRPANKEEVAAVVRFCAERRIAVVPHGGNTSMLGCATPSADGTQIVLANYDLGANLLSYRQEVFGYEDGLCCRSPLGRSYAWKCNWRLAVRQSL